MTLSRSIRRLTKSLAYVHSEAPGAGVFVSPDAILTCAHVARGLKTVIPVRTGKEAKASVEASDDRLDLALLRVEAPCGKPAAISRTGRLVGSDVGMIGFPFSDVFSPPMAMASRGIVGNLYPIEGVEHYVLDVMVTEGFSGAPLFSPEEPEVCGLVSSRFDPVQGRLRKGGFRGGLVSQRTNISFAITSRTILEWLASVGAAPNAGGDSASGERRDVRPSG